MNTKLQKFVSWTLLLGGLAIILGSLYSSYNIFTGKTSAPEIFKVEEKENQAPTPTKGKTPTTQAELQKQMEKVIEEQLKEIVPAKTLMLLLNLITWSIFTGILIFSGGQISTLGIKLMRK